jgi:hypothetical protein
MKKNKFLLLFALLFGFSANIFAQFEINAELRSRGEYREGYKKLLTASEKGFLIVSQRSRLNFNYSTSKIEAKFSVQDVRTWGESLPSNDANSINIFEAWAKYYFTEHFGIKIGRQMLNYGDLRLLANSEWSNEGISHDAALFQYQNCENKVTFDLGFSVSNNDDKILKQTDYTLNLYKYLGFMWFSKSFGENLKFSFIDILDVNQKVGDPETNYARNTFGPLLNINNEMFDIEGVFYTQLGTNREGKKVTAFNAAGKLLLKIGDAAKIGGGYDYRSGTDVDKLSKDESFTFDNLYCSVHTHMGAMDHFKNLAAGTHDLFMKANYGISEKTTIDAEYHFFALDRKAGSTLLDGKTTTFSGNLASELDLKIEHKFSNASLSLGYSFLIPDKNLEKLELGGANSKNGQWAWVIFKFTPTFFKSKNE